MIELKDVTHFATTLRGKGRCVIQGINLAIPMGRRLALIGDPYEDVRVVIDLMAGAVVPSAGRIIRNSSTSFLAGDIRMFVPELSVRGNVQHAARLYAEEARATVDFVQRCLGLGSDFERPFGALPKSVQKSVSHIIAYSIPFDIYILTETLKGGGGLNEVAFALLNARADNHGVIVPTRNFRFAKEFCNGALLYQQNNLTMIDNVQEAVRALGEHQRVPGKRRVSVSVQ